MGANIYQADVVAIEDVIHQGQFILHWRMLETDHLLAPACQAVNEQPQIARYPDVTFGLDGRRMVVKSQSQITLLNRERQGAPAWSDPKGVARNKSLKRWPTS